MGYRCQTVAEKQQFLPRNTVKSVVLEQKDVVSMPQIIAI
jgi:hypothetical protein